MIHRGANLGYNKHTDDIATLISLGCNHFRWQIFSDMAYASGAAYGQWAREEALRLKEFCRTLPTRVVVTPVLMTPTTNKRLKLFWSIFSHELKAERNIFGFDLLNEPKLDIKTWKILAQDITDDVHATDKNRRVIVSTLSGNPEKLQELGHIRDAWVTAHCYNPMSYTHQGTSLQYPYPRYYEPGAVVRTLERIKEDAKKIKMKVFLGEFSVARWAPNGELWLGETCEWLKDNNIPACYHAWREAEEWDLERPPLPIAPVPDRMTTTLRFEVVRKWWAELN